ncbi:M43 family zinc metalloprotease [Fulvivirga sp. M361]|uniref:M43 family zinc metalloprotease n=1 Tax=Fulvivirga sp. M361 TaxID=2594266 RepID=UPI0016267AB8|nr:M43 family zinc metalloprotease [Fulvivirga sp. M361]
MVNYTVIYFLLNFIGNDAIPKYFKLQEEWLYVPVVVHVVYSEESQNISDAQIISQIDLINRDYSRANSDAEQTLEAFKPLAANTRIQFYLARIDPLGNPTNGITRTSTTHGVFANEDIHFADQGGADAWNPLEYLNVWVCDLPPTISGLASTPDQANEMEDGVVIDFESFGTIGTVQPPHHLGRTMTHEVGHYLGLDHTSGRIDGCEDDDGIEDTPLQSASNGNCDLGANSCGSTDMTQNFMNQADDDCLNLFTEGQKEVMRDALSTVRSELITNDKGRPRRITSISLRSENRMEVYPNPSYNGEFFLEPTIENSTIKLVDLSGRPVPFQIRQTNDRKVITIHQTGSFILQWREHKELITTKLINN